VGDEQTDVVRSDEERKGPETIVIWLIIKIPLQATFVATPTEGETFPQLVEQTLTKDKMLRRGMLAAGHMSMVFHGIEKLDDVRDVLKRVVSYPVCCVSSNKSGQSIKYTIRPDDVEIYNGPSRPLTITYKQKQVKGFTKRMKKMGFSPSSPNASIAEVNELFCLEEAEGLAAWKDVVGVEYAEQKLQRLTIGNLMGQWEAREAEAIKGEPGFPEHTKPPIDKSQRVISSFCVASEL
jgi:hypothetical protein